MALTLEHLHATLTKLDQEGAAESVTDEAPIFVAGTLWRCGSTLLQRIVMSDPRALIWGEPIDDKALVDRLAEGLAAPDKGLPFWVGNRPLVELQTSWTTMLWPDPADLKSGMRALFDTWMGAPARRRGFAEWGLKEVRWSATDMMFLRWLYPKSRIFMISRDPVECYASLLKYYYREEKGYFTRWPDRQISSAQTFAQAWSEMVKGWVALRAFEDYDLIRYDQLVAGQLDIPAIGAARGLTLHADLAMGAKVNGAVYTHKTLSQADADDILRITEEARALLAAA